MLPQSNSPLRHPGEHDAKEVVQLLLGGLGDDLGGCERVGEARADRKVPETEFIPHLHDGRGVRSVHPVLRKCIEAIVSQLQGSLRHEERVSSVLGRL